MVRCTTPAGREIVCGTPLMLPTYPYFVRHSGVLLLLVPPQNWYVGGERWCCILGGMVHTRRPGAFQQTLSGPSLSPPTRQRYHGSTARVYRWSRPCNRTVTFDRCNRTVTFPVPEKQESPEGLPTRWEEGHAYAEPPSGRRTCAGPCTRHSSSQSALVLHGSGSISERISRGVAAQAL